MSINIGGIDAAIVIVYLLAVLALGVWIGRGRQTAADILQNEREGNTDVQFERFEPPIFQFLEELAGNFGKTLYTADCWQ